MGNDNNGLKDFASLVTHLNKLSEEVEQSRRPKGPRQKKVIDSDRWTTLSLPDNLRPAEPEKQPVSYTELPTSMRVERLPVRVFQGEHKGRVQWQGRYRLYHKGDNLDHIDLVVNVPRFASWPVDGVWYWVRPLSMAPKKRLVFAELIRAIDHEQDFGTSARAGSALPVVDDTKDLCGQDYWDVMADYEEEVRANSERPDYDY